MSLVTNLYVGGDANRLLHFARAVDRQRIDHRLLVLVPPDPAQDERFGPMLPRFLEHGVRVDCLGEAPRAARAGRSRAAVAWDDLTALRRISARLAEDFVRNRVDVVDARMDHAILLGTLAGRRARVPAVVGTEYGPEFWQTPIRYPVGQLAFRRLAALIVDSEHKRQVYRRWLWGRRPRIEVIANGIHEPQSSRTAAEMRRELGLPVDPSVRVVAQISRVVPYKGHRVLLDAAARVLRQDQRVVFLICGFAHPASYLGELQALARELGIAGRVHFVGYPGPIADVWRAVDVHVHASEFDSSPIALHESMALGLPAVTTDAGGIPELVTDQHNGLVVRTGDAVALARALLRVLREPDLARRLGTAARARFLARHSATVMADALAGLFEKLVGEARTPSAVASAAARSASS